MERINTPDDGDHLVEPPIIDSLSAEPDASLYMMTFVPSDDVSPLEKEQISIVKESEEGRVVAILLAELASLLQSTQSIRRIIHGGDGNFVFTFMDGTRRALAEGPPNDVSTTLLVYPLLQRLSQEVEMAFRMRNRHFKMPRAVSGS